MKLKDVFSNSELVLLQVFLEEEAKCYDKNIDKAHNLTDEGKNWAEKLGEIIANEIDEKFSDGFDYLVICSNSNLGLLNHSLTITPNTKFWNWKNKDLVVSLCSCGNLNHWGTIGRK